MTLDEHIEAMQNMRTHLGRGDVGVFTDAGDTVSGAEDDTDEQGNEVVIILTD